MAAFSVEVPGVACRFEPAEPLSRLILTLTGSPASSAAALDAPLICAFLQRVLDEGRRFAAIVDFRQICSGSGGAPEGVLLRELSSWLAPRQEAAARLQEALVLRVQSNLWSLAARRLLALAADLAPAGCPVLMCHGEAQLEGFLALQGRPDPPSPSSSQGSASPEAQGTLFAEATVLGGFAEEAARRCLVDLQELDRDAEALEQSGGTASSDAHVLHLVASVRALGAAPTADAADAKEETLFGEQARGWAARCLVREYLASRSGAKAPRPPPSDGAERPWVGVPYKLHVPAGLSLLQWLNKMTKSLLVLGEVVFDAGGGFRRPGESQPLFPKGGVDLRWRWAADTGCIVIEFSKDGRPLRWRWDVLRPLADPFALDGAPDWEGTGHVGSLAFSYALLRTEARPGSLSDFLRSGPSEGPRDEDDVGSFLSCYGDDLEQAFRLGGPVSRAASFSGQALELPRRRAPRRPRQNANRVSQYGWLEELLQSITGGTAAGRALDPEGGRRGTPLLVVAGACPNRFCGMQAVVVCQMEGAGIDLWWLKPQAADGGRLEANTLTKNRSGPFKNVAESARKLYEPLAQRFAGAADGDFRFATDAGRAVIEEDFSGQKRQMRVYLVWQESWSSPLARVPFIQGKLCYDKGDAARPPKRLFSRQYRIEGGNMSIAPAADEEEVASLIPPDEFQEMYDMAL